MKDTTTAMKPKSVPAGQAPRILIEGVAPSVDGGLYPAKGVAGEPCAVEATIIRDGHDVIRAVLKWRGGGRDELHEVPMKAVNPGLDLWGASFALGKPGRYLFSIEAWTDAYATWRADLGKRVEAGQASVRGEALEGAQLLEGLARRASGPERGLLKEAASRLREAGRPQETLAAASRAELLSAVEKVEPRLDASRSAEFEVRAERARARFGAWYEMFPRSQGRQPGTPGTFRDAERRLADIKKMGFDVVYLPPIHPIGRTARKGRNNSLNCAPEDPGSPWAIGSPEGGHDAVEPSLGGLEAFDAFAAAAARLGLEVALDFAIQCSPDHPWVKEHPEWFYRRPDGSVKHAENPPKKYEDIYPLNFDTRDRKALWEEMRRVLLFWCARGIRIFRVDNPHTKPLPFWRWLIDEVLARHPDAVFLSEAFTRPPMMRALAKIGFTQSYTYFTWRNTKAELTEYIEELSDPRMRDYFRPNFFANTPDILHEYLQKGGRPAFEARLVLAATLSPSYGIYSGFELCENKALPGREEYQDSEKFEIKVRDWDAPGNIKDLVRKVNAARRDNPALGRLETVRFLPCDNDHILFYAKAARDRSNVLLIAVNLDPFAAQEGGVSVPAAELGLGASYEAVDLLTGTLYSWGERNRVRLEPGRSHLLRVSLRP